MLDWNQKKVRIKHQKNKAYNVSLACCEGFLFLNVSTFFEEFGNLEIKMIMFMTLLNL